MSKLFLYIALAFFVFASISFANPAQSDAQAVNKQEHDSTQAALDESAGSKEEKEGHSHWGRNGASTPFEKLLAYLGKFHALVVHFPIALFLSAALAQVLLLTQKKEYYSDIVRFSVWLAAFGALGAGLLGWAHAGPAPAQESAVMMNHRWIGTTILLGGLATALLMEAARKPSASPALRLAFTITLFVMAAFVAANGFLGGALAHGGMKHLLPGMMG